ARPRGDPASAGAHRCPRGGQRAFAYPSRRAGRLRPPPRRGGVRLRPPPPPPRRGPRRRGPGPAPAPRPAGAWRPAGRRRAGVSITQTIEVLAEINFFDHGEHHVGVALGREAERVPDAAELLVLGEVDLAVGGVDDGAELEQPTLDRGRLVGERGGGGL